MSSSVSSQSHSNWYDDPSLTISEYARKSLYDPPPRVPFTPEELDLYASKYVHYLLLAQQQNDAMKHDPAEINAAHARAQGTLALEQQEKKPIGRCTYADVDATLEDLARKCEKKPRSFDDRVLLATYAANYVLLMEQHILNHPTRSEAEGLKVVKIATERHARILTPPDWQGFSSNETPKPDIELIPADMRKHAHPVTPRALQEWRDNPQTLVGVGFINKSEDNPHVAENGVFFVRDFVSTTRGSRHFDVQFEDSGEDIFPFSPDDVFELIETAEYVRVEQGASLNETPQPTELIPADMRRHAQPVTPGALQEWRDNPRTLVGVGFINKLEDNPHVAENGVFFVRDYVTTARGSCHFDVQFENSGEDIFPFSPGQLFKLVKTAEYVLVSRRVCTTPSHEAVELTEAGSGGIARVAASKRPGHSMVAAHDGDDMPVFAGTGVGPTDRDGAVESVAYLTYTVVSNATCNVDACLDFCDSVQTCVFANLCYEYNELLDFVFSEKSNLKCVVYAEIHGPEAKTNRGGQQSEAPPAGLMYIQQSNFGPLDAANNASGACADLCNSRGVDPIGGACQFINIWRAVVNGIPTTYTCSIYYITTGSDTAVNTGQGDLKVTYSRGYHRRNAYFDAGFEGYADCSEFCFTEGYGPWQGSNPKGGYLDATIFHYAPYAHAGHSVGLLGSATGQDALPGTMAPRGRINTTRGVRYSIMFFLASVYSGPELEADSVVEVLWNGEVVSTIRDGYSPWKYYRVDVDAVGGDVVAFRGGQAPAWTFIDDIYVLQI
ncbi:hypothetical protein FPV67DRAFT_1451811 [Lyophyllum atratum]|nr:hypothetical protein FPV67DRAFT_1451811 [Lyophyllum atratum]